MTSYGLDLHQPDNATSRTHPEACFQHDECRIRRDHAPANFANIKHMASNLLRQAPGKDSLRVKRKVAAWDDDYLAAIVARKSRSPDSPAVRICGTGSAIKDATRAAATVTLVGTEGLTHIRP